MKKIKLFFLVGILAFVISPSIIFAQGGDAAQTSTSDTVVPSDVENVKAIAADKEVTLSWDVATDNVGVTGYKIYYGTKPVRQDGGTYEFPPVLVEDVVTHTVTGLENGKTYYFAVTAVDAAGNESTNYSVEVSATPEEGLKSAALEDDGKPPALKKVEAKAKDEIRVEFSEPVILPIENPEKAFVVKKTADQKELTVKRADLDPEDTRGATVLLLTENHEPGVEYELTVDITVEDHFGNAVKKNEGDKMKFQGFGEVKVAEAGVADTTTEVPAETLPVVEQPTIVALPSLQEVKSADRNQVHVIFSGSIKLSANPKSHFSIAKKKPEDASAAAPDEFLKINNVSLSKDGKTVYLNTDAQEAVDYEIRVSGLTDAQGNVLDSQTVEFRGGAASLFDLVPPEDVTDLIAKLATGKRNVVELMWKKSKNSAGDLADHLLYQTEEGGSFSTGQALGKDTEKTDVKNLTAGKEYTFKITAKDFSGNESKGTLVSIRLPEVGPALPVIVAFSLLAGYFRKRRLRK